MKNRLPQQWKPAALKLKSRNRFSLPIPGYGLGSSLEIPVHVLAGRVRGPRLLVLAGIHGDEYEGVGVLQDLAREIDPGDLKGTLTLVPVANPQAFAAGTRRNPVDLGDLNRSFPGSPGGTLSERLADLLFHELVLAHDCLLSLHGWTKGWLVLPYVEYPIGNTPAHRRSKAATLDLGVPLVHPYRWAQGVLGEAAIRHGIACIEPEVGGQGTVTAEGQQVYRGMVNRLLQHLEMLPPSHSQGGADDQRPQIIGHQDLLSAHAGLFRSLVKLGESVEKGQRVGSLFNMAGDCLAMIEAPVSGIVGILRVHASVQPGDRLVQLFIEKGKPRS